MTRETCWRTVKRRSEWEEGGEKGRKTNGGRIKLLKQRSGEDDALLRRCTSERDECWGLPSVVVPCQSNEEGLRNGLRWEELDDGERGGEEGEGEGGVGKVERGHEESVRGW
jgi:hypothetical protein